MAKKLDNFLSKVCEDNNLKCHDYKRILGCIWMFRRNSLMHPSVTNYVCS